MSEKESAGRNIKLVALLFTLILGLILLVIVSPAAASRLDGADHGGRPLTATLSGAAEVPGPGDADGSGFVNVTINPGQNVVCFEMSVANIDGTIVASHIHRGTADVAGPVVVTLTGAFSDSASGCVAPNSGERALLIEILNNPSDFYINVHSVPDFGPGAIRGQLEK